MEYEVILKPSAQRDLDNFPDKEVQRIAKNILRLSANPRPIGVQKLSNAEGYRIRVGG